MLDYSWDRCHFHSNTSREVFSRKYSRKRAIELLGQVFHYLLENRRDIHLCQPILKEIEQECKNLQAQIRDMFFVMNVNLYRCFLIV